MDAEREQKIVARMEALEEKVSQLSGLIPGAEPIEVSQQKAMEMVDAINLVSLQRILKEVSRDKLAKIFHLQPKKRIEKLKASVSKNSWKDIVNFWKDGFCSYPPGNEHRDFLRIILDLEGRGEIIYVKPEDVEIARKREKLTREEWEERFSRESAELVKKLKEERQRAEEETRHWIKLELAGLVQMDG